MARRKSEEKGPSAPEWIVTFSDMITLLLTFFVMLQSMAKVRIEDHKFEIGRASLQRALASFGLSGTTKPDTKTTFEHPKPQYAVEEGEDQEQDRSLDAETEMLRRLLWDIENMAKISPSPISGKNRVYMPTDIHFTPGKTDLNSQSSTFLSQYCQQLAINLTGEEATIYVLGIAAAEPSQRRQWMLSAQRAQTVADYIKKQQPPESKWFVYSWGAGSGGEWVGQNGLVSPKTEITIAVLTNKQ
jgi:flagellar motor protein MotB